MNVEPYELILMFTLFLEMGKTLFFQSSYGFYFYLGSEVKVKD